MTGSLKNWIYIHVIVSTNSKLIQFWIILALSDEDIVEYLVSRCVPLQGLIKAYSTILEWRLVRK